MTCDNKHIYHKPAFENRIVELLDIKENTIVLDLTYGSGCYAQEILQKINNVQIIALDKDQDALNNRIEDKRLTLFNADFRFFQNYLDYCKIQKVDYIICDLGVSSHQLDTNDRGFSYKTNAYLDMRMNKKAKKTAYEVINTYDENKLSYILKEYGNVKYHKKIANEILNKRKIKQIETTFELVNILKPLISYNKLFKELSKIFLALRIEVNDEINSLKEMLLKAKDRLNNNGKIAIITYHSLEDKIVKNFFKYGNFKGIPQKDSFGRTVGQIFKPLTSKPITPSKEEIINNKRIRSAKLRIAIKI